MEDLSDGEGGAACSSAVPGAKISLPRCTKAACNLGPTDKHEEEGGAACSSAVPDVMACSTGLVAKKVRAVGMQHCSKYGSMWR